MKKLLQQYLASLGLYTGPIDGNVGPGTIKAVDGLLAKSMINTRLWNESRRFVAALQLMASAEDLEVGKIDGYQGPQTKHALELYTLKVAGQPLPNLRDQDEPMDPGQDWPRYRDMVEFYGEPGSADCNAGRVKPPFKMVLAWATASEVKMIACHTKVAPSMQRVLDRVAETYTEEQIRDLGLHLYGGCYNKRLMRGGNRWSVHSWGAAIDFDPMRNMLRTHAPHARLSHPDAVPFWKLWEAEGWLSLGRSRDYDWMHVQAAGL